MATMNVKVLHVSKTTAEWAAEPTIISKGLLCVEFTTDNKTLVKIGDGTKAYTDLPYITDGSFSISDYYTGDVVDQKITDAIAALGNIIHIRGVKDTTDELPQENNTIGDVWFVSASDTNAGDSYSEYIWTEAGTWEFIGATSSNVDLTDYAKTSYVDGLVETINDRLTALEQKAHQHTNLEALETLTPETIEKLASYDPDTLVSDVLAELPTASADTAGTIKVGDGLTVSEDGTLSVDDTVTSDLEGRVAAIEEDYVKSTDDLTLNCQL